MKEEVSQSLIQYNTRKASDEKSVELNSRTLLCVQVTGWLLEAMSLFFLFRFCYLLSTHPIARCVIIDWLKSALLNYVSTFEIL